MTDYFPCPHCGGLLSLQAGAPEPRGKFTPPTLEQLVLHCAKLGLPEGEAAKFIAHHEARGWMLGRMKMKNWQAALVTWRGLWQERQAGKVSPNVELIMRQKELERVEERMRILRGSYSEHSTWDRKDIEEHRALRDRKKELVKLLGMAV